VKTEIAAAISDRRRRHRHAAGVDELEARATTADGNIDFHAPVNEN
jgi:hypothetical protein